MFLVKNGGTSGTLDSLRQALINICKSGCASGNLMGTSDSIGGSATFESVIRQFYPSASDSCTAFLISSPYPKNKQPLYQRQSELYITSCLQQRFTALKNQYTASGFSGTLHEWFQMQLKDDYKLTEAELTSLETQLASGCKYLKRPLVLPVAMSCDADGITVEPSCVDSATVAGLLSGFSTMYPGLTSANERYEILITNYFNHSLGFALSYEDYDEYFQLMQTGTVNGQLLCARSQSSFDNTISEIETCMSSVFMSAYSSAINLYTAYIDSVRAAFRTAYFTKCLTATAGSSLKSTYLEYHYTLYYYDQSGNLVKTIPPEGVDVVPDSNLADINQNRIISNRYCFENSPYVNFTGVNSVDINTPNGIIYFWEPKQITVEAFVKLNNFSNQGIFSYNGDFIDFNNDVIENGFALLVKNGKLVLVSGTRTYGTSVKNERESPVLTNFLTAGQWFHVSLVYSKLALDPVRLYINGTRIPLANLNAASPYFHYYYMGFNNTPIKLGAALNDSTTTFLQGGLKHFRMYTRSLGQAEIIQNAFNSCLLPASTSGLCCNIPLYEGTGNSPRDYIANLTGAVSSGNISWANYVDPFYPEHKLPTVYEYNSLNQIVRQSSPDGDTTRFWYDALGRLVASQNEEQRDPRNTMANSATDRYSFTRYDQLGRIIEVGEKEGGDILAFGEEEGADSKLPLDLVFWYQSGDDYSITFTSYDEPNIYWVPYTDITILQAQNGRNRVASTFFKDSREDEDYQYATHYVYDIGGNVKTLFQDNPNFISLLPSGEQVPHRIDYEYDLVSGKVNKLLYQSDKQDQFYYKYRYDSENRVTAALSSRDNLWWENDARYFYHIHGPLARIELGHHNVQGIDYAYTLQGWLKGINGQVLDPEKDMSGDGLTGGDYPSFSRDVLAFSLSYHDNDYKPIGESAANAFGLTFTAPSGPVGTSGNTGYNLYNGNIRNTTLALDKINNKQTTGYSYLYDQLNRLTATKQHTISGSSWSYDNFLEAYRERIAYDANGNIKKYLRHGADATGMPLKMDSLSYEYIAGTNQLSRVRDSVGAGNYTVDIDDQGAENYEYDMVGNLISDAQGGIANIAWTPYGKIRTILKSNYDVIDYAYDAAGNRVSKFVNTSLEWMSYFYIRDAQGNVLAVYRNTEEGLFWDEQHLYGSSRLGMWKPGRLIAEVEGAEEPIPDSSLIGSKQYELTNHLGNVLAVISDKKVGIEGSTSGTISHYEAEVLTANDYYPFGMLMPGRGNNVGEGYRYGFNGKENDNEIKGDGAQQDYGMRIYDPRLGRFLSVDPLTKQYPHYTPYSFAGNMPIQFIDIDGMEQGFDIRFKQMQRGYLKGTVTESELKGFYEANAQGAALGVGILLTRGAILRYGPSLFLWATNPANQQLIGTAGMVGVGLMDPNPSGAPTADLPGVGDDVGRLVKASTKKLFNSIKPILERRRDLAKAWGVAQKYIDFSKKVFTKDIEEGTELIQFRRKGAEGTVGDYFALPGTTPEQIGMNPNDITEALTIKVKNKTKVLFSTHKKNLPYYRDETIILQGGGLQIFSKDLKNNVEIIKKTPVNGVN